MARAKGTMSVDVDIEDIEALNGFMQTLNVQTKSARYIGPALMYAHTKMADNFDRHMDRMALATKNANAKSPFEHVYEWGMLGLPQGRLWDNRLEGGGASRLATFNWRASKRTVPVPDDDLGPNAGEKAFKRIHVFVWKAMVMEFQSRVTIAPKRGEWLGWASTGPNSIDGLEFSKGPIVINPGGGVAQGSFTAAFAEWWGGPGAANTFDREVRTIMEKKMVRGIENNFPTGVRARKKNLAIRSFTSSRPGAGPGYQRGAKAARQFLEANRRDYIADARRREEFTDTYGGNGGAELDG